MAGSIEFTPPYQDGWQDNEEGATPITADILNNNYDAFLLLLNTWIGNIEEELVAVPDFQISSPSSGQVLKYDGSKWVNAAESGGGSTVSWNQILQSGTQIASITINGTSYTVYAPTPITNLNGLSDVTLASPSNGQVLQFNSNTSKWENKSISVGDSVEFTQVLSSGVKIGTITIDGTDYDIYAPQGGGGSYEPNGVTYTIVNNSTDETQSGQTARSIVVNKFEDDVQTDTGSLSYATVVTTGPTNFTVGNVKTTYTLASGTAYWVLTVVSGHIQYNGTLYETDDEILRTPVVGSSVITLTDIEEMEESHSTVIWTQTQQSGTKIAEISIDGVSQNVYIPNLPTKTSDLTNDSNFVADASYVHTDNNYTTTEKNKLADLNQVEANPSSGTSAGNLNSIEIGGTKYDIPSGGGGGTTVIANPSGTPTDELEKLQVGSTIYSIPSGGSGGGSGFSKTTLYAISGTTPESVITLSQSLENFDLIEVVSLYGHSDEEDYKQNAIFNAEELVASIGATRPKNWWVGNDTAYVWFYVTDNDEITIHNVSGQSGLGIWYVYGYKFEGGSGGSASWKDITGTLVAGQTQITLSDVSIAMDSTIDAYTNKFGVNPTNMEMVSGQQSQLQPFVTSESELVCTVTADSYYNDFYPWKAFESSGQTGWVGWNSSGPEWIAFEFSSPVKIEELEWICLDQSRAGTIDNLQYSSDGTTWNNCTLSTNERGHAVVTGSITAKHWRMYFAGPYQSWGEPMITKLQLLTSVNGVRLAFPAQSENLNVKVRVS